MADEAQAPQGAPSAPPMVAPAQPTAAAPKKRRRRNTSGNGASPKRGGRPALSAEEKAARQAERERVDQQRRAHVRSLARIASIGALQPGLLEVDEIGALAKFTLAQLQGQPPQQAEPDEAQR
jgi:hypothetical protein